MRAGIETGVGSFGSMGRGMGAVGRWFLVVVLVAGGCSRPLLQARTAAVEPVFPAEERAAARQSAPRCSDSWGLLFPGLGQLCLGKDGAGAALFGLGAAEVTTGVLVGQRLGYEHPGSAVPLLAFQDLWVYGNSDVWIERALARRELYAPQDTLADLLAAPINLRVLERTDVWLGTLVSVGLGVGMTFLLSDVDSSRAGGAPNLFGREFSPAVGYPAGVLAGAGLLSHVAIAEEALFRGVVQSDLARRTGERAGWLWGSAIFGLSHSLNALVLPPEDRAEYLLTAVPVITVLGSYLGYAYRRSGYNLSVPVAIHFWYDLLLSTTFFVMDPQNSPLSASITVVF